MTTENTTATLTNEELAAAAERERAFEREHGKQPARFDAPSAVGIAPTGDIFADESADFVDLPPAPGEVERAVAAATAEGTELEYSRIMAIRNLCESVGLPGEAKALIANTAATVADAEKHLSELTGREVLAPRVVATSGGLGLLVNDPFESDVQE